MSFYIDGFNLYHAVDAVGDNSLKWMDLWSIAQSYATPDDNLVSVVFFTALNNWDAAKRARHISFNDAQNSRGVEVELSNFRSVPKVCHTRGQRCRFKEEKKTDVKIALRMLRDCVSDSSDKLFLVTNDSDQVPTLEIIRRDYPRKKVFVISPPGRQEQGYELKQVANANFSLTAGRIRQHPLPRDIRDSRGKLLASRPAVYGP